jgi:hypothetical protein
MQSQIPAARFSIVFLALALASPALAQPAWQPSGSNLFFTGGQVSIGTGAAVYPLYVLGGNAAIVGTTTNLSAVSIGVQGQSNSTTGRGVYGFATASTGQAYGGLFRTVSNQGTGVFALADAATGVTAGVRAQAASSGGAGIWGIATSAAGNTAGIRGQSNSSAGSGVISIANSSTGFTNGIFGESISPDGAGVSGLASSATGVNYGVYGETDSTSNGYGVYCVGDTAATGLKLFQIDHPLDPANHYLNHFSAEGPEPYLVYRGNATLDQHGEAVVTLPAYFDAINVDPTYQLTPIGAAANLYISQEVKGGRFAIAGGKPGMRVSWTVTGVRHDAFVQRYGAVGEPLKPLAHRGRFLHPELFGMPRSMAIRPRPVQQVVTAGGADAAPGESAAAGALARE